MKNKIKELRLQNNLTQEYMADALCISQNAYSLIENNKTRLVDVERIKIIADKLNVSPFELGLFEEIGISAAFNKIGKNDKYNYIQSINTANIELTNFFKDQLFIKDNQIERLNQQIEKLISQVIKD
jgi:transcriptional regulator with XRE-family HTH domain